MNDASEGSHTATERLYVCAMGKHLTDLSYMLEEAVGQAGSQLLADLGTQRLLLFHLGALLLLQETRKLPHACQQT